MAQTAAGLKIRVTAKDRASTGRRAELARAFAEMNAAPHAQVHYLALLHRTAKRTDGSGLGLGRITAEGEMSLRYEAEGDMIIMTAEPIEMQSQERS